MAFACALGIDFDVQGQRFLGILLLQSGFQRDVIVFRAFLISLGHELSIYYKGCPRGFEGWCEHPKGLRPVTAKRFAPQIESCLFQQRVGSE